MHDSSGSFSILSNNNKSEIDNNITNRTSSSIKPVNHSPVANAGVNQTVNENTTVILNGIASDPDPNDILTHSWTQIAGPSVILEDGNTTNPSFTTPRVSGNTALKFSLTAKDNKGATSTPVTAAVAVKHTNHPPTVDAGPDQTVSPGFIVLWMVPTAKTQRAANNYLILGYKLLALLLH